jgi:anti-sigma factor RsiW
MENINRHNYETWLMLYLDNELTASERQSVDAFLEQHPDLKQELQGLKEVMLESAVPAAMPGKDRLLRPEAWNADALTLQQEQLLMLADGTLQNEEKQKLESEIRQSPLLQNEWGLLQKAILKADLPNEMPGKSSLYRNEKAKTVSMARWYRIAAAAAILAFGWFFAAKMLAPDGTTDNTEMAVVKETEPSSPKTTGKAEAAEEDIVKNDEVLNEVPMITVVEPELQAPREKSAELIKVSNQKDNKTNLNIQSIVIEERNQKMEVIKDIAVSPVIKNIEIDGVDAPLPNTITVDRNTTFINVQEEAPVRNYEILELENNDEDDTINIAGARISKQKVRGLYRNITRPIAKTFDKNSPRTNETK